jgi:hypothetical protein
MSEQAMLSLFQDLIRRVDAARRQRDRDLGAIAQRRKLLKETYGVDDLEEAKGLREKAHRRMMKRAEACLEAKKKFEAALAKRPESGNGT